MNEQDLQEFLTEAIETLIDQSLRTFEEAMILTNDKGLVINFNDTEFLVRIVKK